LLLLLPPTRWSPSLLALRRRRRRRGGRDRLLTPRLLGRKPKGTKELAYIPRLHPNPYPQTATASDLELSRSSRSRKKLSIVPRRDSDAWRRKRKLNNGPTEHFARLYEITFHGGNETDIVELLEANKPQWRDWSQANKYCYQPDIL